jgi:hypothetical protein
MGLEILRRLAFVAPVPRAEDVGIDAMCTLQRRDGEMLYPEDTFAVQIKSWTTRSLSLEEPDMAWLHGLDLPLFLVSVDLKGARGAVYSLINLFGPGNRTLREDNGPPTEPIEAILDPPASSQYGMQPWVASLGPPPTIWIGPPVFAFRFDEVDDPAFHQKAYLLLKAHVEAASVAIRARRVRTYLGYRLTENAPPQLVMSGTHGGDEADIENVLVEIVPQLERLRAIVSTSDAQGRSELGTAVTTLVIRAYAARSSKAAKAAG